MACWPGLAGSDSRCRDACRVRLVLCHHHARPELDWRPLGRLRSGGAVEYELSPELGVVLVRYDDWWLAGASLVDELRELVERTLDVTVEGEPILDE